MTRPLLAIVCAFLALAPSARAQALDPVEDLGDDDGEDYTSPLQPQSAPTLAEVRVEGNRRVEAEAIRKALVSRAGQPLDRNKLREDIRSLWRLGFFSDVQIFLDQDEQGRPILLVRVQEKPAVRQARLRGNKELSDDDLKDTIDIKPFSILDLAAVKRNARKIQDKYVEKGFFLAEVKETIEPVDNNEVIVWFDVNERAKVEVRRITFVGNEKVPDKDLKEVMQTEEGNFLSFITNAGTYREEVFQRDLAALQGVYYDRGFIHVKVGNPKVSLSADSRSLYLTIPISEGEQYNIGAIDFSGDLLTEKADLQARMTVTSGELFNRTKLQRDILALTDVYHDQGYAYANITPQTNVHPEKRIVDLTFDIQKGEKVYIERIEIVGNTKTRDKVIRRELRIYEGELFSGTGLRLSRQRVTALGFFESVDITYKRGSTDDTMVMTVSVKEKPTGTFQVGFGFSSIENFIFTAQISQNNLLGWGQTASLSAQISSLRSLIQLSFIDPYFMDTRTIFSFNYFRQELDYFGFIRRSNGGDVNFGYQFVDNVSASVGYSIEAIEVQPGGLLSGGSDILLANRFRNGLTSSVRLSGTWDKRNNRLFPSEGFFQQLTVEHSPSWLGATFLFTRYTLNTRWYYPLPFGLVAKAQGIFGYIDGDDLPISELYFAGGINTIRGYQLRSIAPAVRIGSSRNPAAPLQSFNVGGNKQVLFNLELEFPIFEKVGIRGVVFYDAGNVFSEDETVFRPRDQSLPLGLFHSPGFGFRWFSPIGPLRFEWGFP
ncbi:MAG: outer membrane protein assembly factor BamA, partial [Myxococcales bacterium]